MGADPADWDALLPGATAVVVRTTADSGAVERRLAARASVDRVETTTPADAAAVVASVDPDVVVCLPAGGADHSTEDDGATDATGLVAAVADARDGVPILVVGTGVDAAAAYAAGAAEVVPVDPDREAGTAVERIAAALGRRRETRAVEGLLAATGDGVIVHDPETGEVCAASRGAYATLGHDPADHDLTLADLARASGDDAVTVERIVAMIRRAADGSTERFGWTDRPTDGDPVRVAVSLEATALGGERYVVATVSDGTERERATEATTAAREETERTLARIDEAFLALDGDWRIGYLNERAGALFGVDPGDAAGSVVWERLPDLAGSPLERTVRNAVETGLPRSVEAELSPLDGRFEIDAYPDDDGLSVFLRDVTDRTERERELYVTERAMAEASVALALVDPSRPGSPVVYVNDAFEELTGYDRSEALGRDWRFLEGPGTDPETAAEIAAAVEAEETISTEIRHYRKDGTPFWNRLDVTPIYDEDGALLRVLASGTDVTEQRRRRRVREELLSTTRELMAAGSRAAIARTVSDAARSILDHDLNVVYLRAGGDAGLEAVAWTDGIDDLFGGPLAPSPDGPVRETFERGEATIVDEFDGRTGAGGPERDGGDGRNGRGRGDGADGGPVDSLLLLPLGEHGVLAVGETEPDAFDRLDVDTGELLTLNAAAALDRMARVRELEEYETLFETVQDLLYVVDDEGYVRMVTAPLADALGYDRETLRGRHVSTVLTDETVEEGRRLVVDLLVTPESVSNRYEGTMVSRDGEEIPVEIELSVLPHEEGFRGTVGAVRDISRRRTRERELRVFRRAITEAGIGLAMYGDDGRFSYVNEQYANLLGYERPELEASPVWTAFEHVTEGSFADYWADISPGETRTRETENRRADGSTVSVEAVTTAVTIDGERYHIDTIQEITDRRERRQQTEVLHRILRHNLRNDLTVIRAHASRLADLVDDDVGSAEKIVETVGALSDLVDTAREAERIVDRETVRRPIDVCELLREAVADLPATDATVETDLPATAHVSADPLLGEAIGQLLANAIEHNDAASPTVSVAVAAMPDRAGWLTVEIADDGPGIPEQEQAVLTAGEETPLRHGSGLGLWIVHWIVTRYGGELRFEPREPRGSRVIIALPAADEPADGDAADRPDDATPDRPDETGGTDDSAPDRPDED